jgi:hypothetical protein
MKQLRIAMIVLFAAAVSIILSGCGTDDGLGERFSISGAVTYKGEPLKKGKINFVPEKSADRSASGDIEDGSILNVTTQSPGDGLAAGKYKVSITAVDDVNLDAVTKKHTGAPDPVAVAKVANKAKKLIPAKYGSATDSGLTAEVSSSNRKFKFDLTD